MKQDSSLWEWVPRALQGFVSHYMDDLASKGSELGLDARRKGWRVLFPARTYEPDPVTVERLWIGSPYTARVRYLDQLKTAHRSGFLQQEGPGKYRLTQKGHSALGALLEVGYARMRALQPIPRSSQEQLLQLLEKAVHNAEEGGVPPYLWCLPYSRRTDPGPSQATIVRIDQLLTDLAAYRDDCHLASWRGTGIDAHSWEILTQLWREGPRSLGEIAVALAGRGYLPEEDEDSVVLLRGLSLIESNGGALRITKSGLDLREKSEQLTDEYFDLAWKGQPSQEKIRTRKLLQELAEGLS